jgi:prepilin-type N-terminal cleavage/methylation domain-containing protein
MCSRRWADQRGFTLAELLVAAVVGAVVLLGMFSVYRATTTSFNQSSSRAYLQRQGTLALQEIARQAQRASASATVVGTCPPAGITPSLALTVIDTIPPTPLPVAEIGTYCYYPASSANSLTACSSSTPCTLWERFTQKSNGSIRSRDLLFGATGLMRQTGQRGVSLLLQTSPADARCPTGVTTSGKPCLTLSLTATLDLLGRADVVFAIGDGLDGMTFTASLKRRNS